MSTLDWLLNRIRRPDEGTPRITGALSGHLEWELVSRSGLIVQRGEQSNMVLTSGLDLLPTHGVTGVQTYAVVGTGATEPNPGQSALVAEAGRTASLAPSTSDTITRPSNGVFVRKVSREFPMAAAVGNLTEWGFAPLGSGGLFCRELFRDGSGNAIVLTKTNQQFLRLTYSLQLTLSPLVPTAGVVNVTNIGNMTGKYCWIGSSSQYYFEDFEIFNRQLTGDLGSTSNGAERNLMVLNSDVNSRNMTYAGVALTGLASKAGTSAPAYVPGSYTRQGVLYTFTTSEGNGTIIGYVMRGATGMGSQMSGYAWAFDGSIVKTNSDQFTMRGPTVSWSR